MKLLTASNKFSILRQELRTQLGSYLQDLVCNSPKLILEDTSVWDCYDWWCDCEFACMNFSLWCVPQQENPVDRIIAATFTVEQITDMLNEYLVEITSKTSTNTNTRDME